MMDLTEKLRHDLAAHAKANAMCEGCGAQLFDGDDFFNDEVSGCWQWASGFDKSSEDSPCYKYRVPEMSEPKAK